jgi:capsular exopolysaccharide synthesis family protein
MSHSSHTVGQYDSQVPISRANYNKAISLADAVSASNSDLIYSPSEPERAVSEVCSQSPVQDELDRIHLVEPQDLEQVSDSSRLVALKKPQGLEMEPFRLLAARLRQLRDHTRLKTLQLCSCVDNEGKSLISANLALTLARGTEKVLLIEGDLRRPCFHDLLKLSNHGHGLVNYLSGDEPLANVVCRLNSLPLWVLPAGESLASPLDFLQPQRLSTLVSVISDSFDWIIIDSPPLIPFGDASVWGQVADGTLLVVRPGVTPKKAMHQAISGPDTLKLLGIVVNESYIRDGYRGMEILTRLFEMTMAVWRCTTRRAREVIERGMEIGTRSFEMTMAAGRNITQRVRETIEKGYR